MQTETAEQALNRIQSGFSKNDERVIYAFAEAGIDPEDITPRENVLTFKAWKAKGRSVAKGAKSIRVITWIPCDGKRDQDADGKEKKRGKMRPKTAFLFHISQTITKDAPKGTRPDAWENPELVRAGTYEDEPKTIQPEPPGMEPVDLSLASFTKVSAKEQSRKPIPVTPQIAPLNGSTPLGLKVRANDKPEAGKVYSLFEFAKGKALSDCEVTSFS